MSPQLCSIEMKGQKISLPFRDSVLRQPVRCPNPSVPSALPTELRDMAMREGLSSGNTPRHCSNFSAGKRNIIRYKNCGWSALRKSTSFFHSSDLHCHFSLSQSLMSSSLTPRLQCGLDPIAWRVRFRGRHWGTVVAAG